ncbi:MAG: MFS transporter [Alphaproteobacteria bacterium]|jgi:predicted MFS family arabinose efflux permease|nr:MFS transporter [Alphaproteobacteria bacterium]
MTNQNNTLLKNPFRITFVMAMAIFGVITTEFGLIGGLHLIAESFGVSLSQAGLLLSTYAFVVAVFGPFMVLTFSKYNKKYVLMGAVGLFFISTALSAVSQSYIVMMISRIIGALGHSLVWSLALAIAASCFPPEKRAKSVSYVNLGFILATVAGIPLASYLSTEFDWRWGFSLAAFSNFMALVAVLLLVPSLPNNENLTFGNQLSVLKKPIVWLNIISTSTAFAGMFTVYGYFAPFFKQTANMNDATISIMLMLFGLLGILGNTFFGKFTTLSNIYRVFLSVIILVGITYTLMEFFNHNLYIIIALILVWGVLFSAGGVVFQVWCTMNATEAPTFANSLYVSFANIGITLGTFFGSLGIKFIGIESVGYVAITFLIISLVLYVFTIKVNNNMQKGKI